MTFEALLKADRHFNAMNLLAHIFYDWAHLFDFRGEQNLAVAQCGRKSFL